MSNETETCDDVTVQTLCKALCGAEGMTLESSWQAHQRQGLEIRHATGRLLNANLGPPLVGDDPNWSTIKELGSRLPPSQSELKEMRWFSHYFRSVDHLLDEHPWVRCWTDVKKVMKGIQQLDRPRFR